MYSTSDWLGTAQVPRFKAPVDMLVWVAEQYIESAARGSAPPMVLGTVLGQLLTPASEDAFLGALDFLMFHSTIPVVATRREHPTAQPHARAVGEALSALMESSLERYCKALAPVLLAEDGLALGPTLQALANELGRLRASGLQQSARPTVVPFAETRSRVLCH